MSLKPVRFIGHKIGPFDHIELNWHEDSRSTIIVGENGTGKTTLVAAMAACLGAGYPESIQANEFHRFACDDESYAFFELLNGSKDISSLIINDNDSDYLDMIWQKYNHNSGYKDIITVDTKNGRRSPKRRSIALTELHETWSKNENVDVIAAAYGSFRDLTNNPVTGYKDITESPFKEILKPTESATSSTVSQWITNQHIRRAFALMEEQVNEADLYVDSINRVEEFLADQLGLSYTFRVERNPLSLMVTQNGSQIPLSQLSDGTRSFLSWTLDYLSRAERVNWNDPADASKAPGAILVDEIDSHLHPEWQKRIIVALEEIVPCSYIIATTHSPFVIGSADDSQIFHIVKNGDGKLEVESSYDELYGQPADIVLKELFTDSLYTPEIEKDLERLSELMGKLTFGEITSEERQEHDRLFEELSTVSPWLSNLLAMTQASQNGS